MLSPFEKSEVFLSEICLAVGKSPITKKGSCDNFLDFSKSKIQ